ncbi:MAG: hypothetical protein E6R03_17025 [Hyphomicrobiaceae bacterium]|nr:MAG: hypothetical protein E6R03_17025 [Hyphomicrobiaceae bacterium]
MPTKAWLSSTRRCRWHSRGSSGQSQISPFGGALTEAEAKLGSTAGLAATRTLSFLPPATAGCLTYVSYVRTSGATNSREEQGVTVTGPRKSAQQRIASTNKPMGRRQTGEQVAVGHLTTLRQITQIPLPDPTRHLVPTPWDDSGRLRRGINPRDVFASAVASGASWCDGKSTTCATCQSDAAARTKLVGALEHAARLLEDGSSIDDVLDVVDAALTHGRSIGLSLGNVRDWVAAARGEPKEADPVVVYPREQKKNCKKT